MLYSILQASKAVVFNYKMIRFTACAYPKMGPKISLRAYSGCQEI